MASIRPYRETDFDACAHICQATLPPSLASNPVNVKLAPFLWTHPYTFLSPQTSLVLDDGTGTAVGYCIGCADVFALAAAYPAYVTAVLEPAVARPANTTTREPWTLLDDGVAYGQDMVSPVALAQLAYNARWLLLDGNEALTGRWRATMHIDLLGPWQGRGWGRRLVEAFEASVRASSGADGGAGVHIGIAGENAKVVPFYEKLGFRLVEKPAGAEGGTIHMTKDFEKA